MSSFRDALDADADDVFLDLDAFADEHTFMGQEAALEEDGRTFARVKEERGG